MEFEFNFGEQQISKPQDMTLYASVDGIAQQLAEDELVFMDYKTGKNHIMTLQVLQALGLTQQFRPLHEHIQQIAQAIPTLKNQQQAIEKVLQFLINKNLIISAEEWLETIKNEAPTIQQVPYAGMVVRTCDRPDQLLRLLESLEKYQSIHNSEHPVLVFDDSENDKSRDHNEKLCKQSKLAVKYHGRSWQSQFIGMLKKEWPGDGHLIDWLLAPQSGFTGGRVWNLALLALAGKRFSFYDDDYLIQPRISDRSHLDFIDLAMDSPLNIGFGLNVHEIKDQSKPYEGDLLQQMVNACGESFGAWISRQKDLKTSSLYGLRLLDLDRINTDSVLKTTGNGTWGSPRAAGNYWLYLLNKEQREAFWQDRETYLDNIDASHLLHYAGSFQALTKANFAPSTIDNGDFMPFTMPKGVNEDYYFGSMAQVCYPHNVSLQFPVMMGHLQTENRDRSHFNHIARRPGINSFVADYLTSVAGQFFSNDAVIRFQNAKAAIDDLIHNPDQMLLNRLREYLSRTQSNLIHQLQQILAEVDEPPIYWQADVKELIETNGAAIKSDQPPLLNGWSKDLTALDCVKQLRTELLQVSDAMAIWPKLWAFCQTQ